MVGASQGETGVTERSTGRNTQSIEGHRITLTPLRNVNVIDLERIERNARVGDPSLGDPPVKVVPDRVTVISLCTAVRHLRAQIAMRGGDAVRICELETALDRIRDLLYEMPGGIDEEADASDNAPESMPAHIAGLILREINKAIGENHGRVH